jgi:phage-related baseplate assembly protein
MAVCDGNNLVSCQRARHNETTHYPVNNSMLSKQDNLARRRHDQALDLAIDPVFSLLSETHRRLLLLASDSLELSARSRLVDNAHGTGLKQGSLEVVDQVLWVLDTHAKTDEIFRQITFGSNFGIDRRMTGGG